MRRLIARCLVCLLAFSAACAKKSATRTDTYVYLTISDIDSLDPAWAYDTASQSVILNIYEPLLDFKGESATELEPRIAEKLPSRANGLISRDGRVYTFPIRKGVKFQEGQTLTPEDVRYSLMRFMLFDRDAGPSSILLEPVVGYASTREHGKILDKAYDDVDKAVQARGDNVILTLRKPFAPILTVLASWAPMVSREWCAKNGEWDGTKADWAKHNNPDKESSFLYSHANGTGPFLLKRWDIRAKEIVLKRFDRYWQGPAKLKWAIIRGVDEFATRKLMLQAGDADAIYADRLQLPLLQNIPGVQLIDDLPCIQMNPVVFFTFHLDTTANPNVGTGLLDGNGIPADFFADPDMRKGFAYSVDYEAYIRDIARGKGTRATGFIPKGLLGYRENLPHYGFDLGKAAAHFKKAYGGKVWEKGFRLTFAYNAGNEPREAIAHMIKRNVESLNPKFKVDTRPIQWSTYLDQMNHSKLPVFILGWVADYPDPHNFAFNFMHSKGNFPALQHYKNERADALIEKAMGELDAHKRAELYAQIQELAYEDVPSLYILNTLLYRTQRTWVKGFINNPVWPDAPWSCPLYPLWKSADKN